jgi:hypothetical protein
VAAALVVPLLDELLPQADSTSAIAPTPATVAASRFLVALWATRLTSISLDSV